MYRILLVAFLSLAVPAVILATTASAQEKDTAAEKAKAEKKDSGTKDVVQVQAVHIFSIDGYLWFMAIFGLALLVLNAVLLIMIRSDLAKPGGPR